VNLFTQTPFLSSIAKKAAGMPLERQIPAFAPETFRAWFQKRGVRNQGEPHVILWPDTFNNYFFPETAQAAVQVLERLGYTVEVPMKHLCCGRPLYDYGFLDRARKYLTTILDALEPAIAAGTPVVVLEPSCCSVFRDELHGLMPDSARAHHLKQSTFLLSEFLQRKVPDYRPPQLKRKAIVQAHCHHKAIMRLNEEEALMSNMGLDFEVLKSGCCGMAGSFGFEKSKYGVSLAVGEHGVLPAARHAGLSTIIMADGFSCREQISQQTGRHALHLADVLQLAQRDGIHGASWIYPEQDFVAQRKAGLRRARRRAIGLLAGAVVGGLLLAMLAKKL
jgi:Fe-S oxidoreductase